MTGNDIESDTFTELLDMAHSNEFKVIIKEYTTLLEKLSIANDLTPQEFAALIYFANERLSAAVSMTFTFHSMDFMGDQNHPLDISSGGDYRVDNLVSDLLTKIDQIPKDGHFPKVLKFFLEHPMHAFDVSQIAEYLDISRDDVKKNLDLIVDFGYIMETEEKDHYELKRSKEMLQTLSGYLDEIGTDLICKVSSDGEPEKGEKQLHAGLEDGGLNLIVFDGTEQLRKMLNVIGFPVDDDGIVTNKGEPVTCSGCGCKLTVDEIGHVMPPDHFYCSKSICIMDYYGRYGHLGDIVDGND